MEVFGDAFFEPNVLLLMPETEEWVSSSTPRIR